MREIFRHRINGLNEILSIRALDELGHGGANHVYRIYGPIPPRGSHDTSKVRPALAEVSFQNGPIAEVGVNGVSNEALLAIVEDRLISFQNGPFACSHNEIALNHVRHALDTLKARTEERIQRGVEGTSQR